MKGKQTVEGGQEMEKSGKEIELRGPRSLEILTAFERMDNKKHFILLVPFFRVFDSLGSGWRHFHLHHKEENLFSAELTWLSLLVLTLGFG